MSASGAPDQAMVLAAGRGERLKPLTLDRAKPSLPLMNRALVLHNLDLLNRAGVRHAVVNLHYAPESLDQVLDGWKEAPEILLSREDPILGTGGGLAAGLALLDPGKPLLALNGDSLGDLDLVRMAGRHREARQRRDAPATLALRPRRPGDTFTPVYVDGEGAVCGIGRTGEEGAPHVFLGAHILEPELLAGRPTRPAWDVVRDLYMPLLREGGRLGAFVHQGWWLEIGTPRLYLEAHLAALERRAFLGGLPAAAGAPVGPSSPTFAGPGCTGLEAAALDRSVLGAGCVVGEDSRVERSLLGAGAHIGHGAVVRDSIVWDGCIVEKGAHLEGMLVHPGAESGMIRLS